MDADLRSAIKTALSASHSLGLDPILVGALVSELVASEEPDLRLPRGTSDADFAVRIKDWKQFGSLKASLFARGFTPDPRIEHRLHLASSMVDLLPYGPEISKGGEIVWPDSQHTMVVVGFEEACSHSVESTLESGLVVKRVTIPGLTLLKIIAFADRRAAGHPKFQSDAEDLVYWFKNYAAGREESRRFDLADHGVTTVEYLDAGAAVLGLDVRKLVSPGADRRVREFLEESDDLYCSFVNASVLPGTDDRRRGVLKLLHAFRAGYEANA